MFIHPTNTTPGKNTQERAVFAMGRFTICLLHTVEEFNAVRKKISLGLKSPLTATLWSHPGSQASVQIHNLYKNQGNSLVDYYCLYFIFNFTFKTWMKWDFFKSKNLVSMTFLTSTELYFRAMPNDNYNPHLTYKVFDILSACFIDFWPTYTNPFNRWSLQQIPYHRWSLRSEATSVFSRPAQPVPIFYFLYHLLTYSQVLIAPTSFW